MSLETWVEKAGERPWFVGERVRDKAEGYAATVRYIGPVASAKDQTAIYLGVEWDDATRGKHDGSAVVVNAPVASGGTASSPPAAVADAVNPAEAGPRVVQHFVCAAGAGSFVKPKKLSRGESYSDVMRRRYVGMGAEMVSKDNKLDIEECNVKTWNGRALPIEVNGRIQIQTLSPTLSEPVCAFWFLLPVCLPAVHFSYNARLPP